MNGETWGIRFHVPASVLGVFEEALEPYAEAVSTFEEKLDSGPEGLWLVEGTTQEAPDEAAIERALTLAAKAAGVAVPAFTTEHHRDRNWLTENLQAFPPRRIGRYFVHGCHVTDKPPVGAVPILVDAATAFGSGSHPSTAGCLSAFDRLARRRRFEACLDMGCGSGILALALAKTFHGTVLAADMDPESIRVTRFNAKRNGVSRFIRAVESRGFDDRAVKGRYDLIAANILARPLAAMAKDLSGNLASGGYAVLSGILAGQEKWVANAYRAQGLALARRILIDGWVTLVLKK